MLSIEKEPHKSTAVTATRDPLRAQLHQMWNGVAPAWAAHLGYVDSRGRHVSDRMLELTRPGPGGQVVVSDFAGEMVAVAADRAHAAGLANVAGKVIDLEQIDEPGASFDVVLCREGLMLVPDPERG